jgi:hypothetical protein
VIFKLPLPSVGEKTLGKELFAECCICDTRQRALWRVSKIKHSAKSFFAECFLLLRVFCVALGKEPNFGSGLVIASAWNGKPSQNVVGFFAISYTTTQHHTTNNVRLYISVGENMPPCVTQTGLLAMNRLVKCSRGGCFLLQFGMISLVRGEK